VSPFPHPASIIIRYYAPPAVEKEDLDVIDDYNGDSVDYSTYGSSSGELEGSDSSPPSEATSLVGGRALEIAYGIDKDYYPHTSSGKTVFMIHRSESSTSCSWWNLESTLTSPTSELSSLTWRRISTS
jgi:hypothetical protein